MINKEHKKFIYNNVTFLLIIIIADGALFKYEMLNDLQKQKIPVNKNELFLRFKESALNQLILCKYIKAKRVTDKSIFRFTFVNILYSILRLTEYFYATSIYTIYHQLDKKINK